MDSHGHGQTVSSERSRASPSKKEFKSIFQATIDTQEQGQRIPLRVEINRQMSPVSPEFDDISTLPTPVVSEASPRLFSSRADSPALTNAKTNGKSYGGLIMRPSLMESFQKEPPSSRVVSELGSMHSMDRLSNSINSVLDSKQQGPNRSPPKRNTSTPLSNETVILERERVVSDVVSGQFQELYSGVDNDGHIHKWRKVSQLGKGTFSTVILGETVDNQCPEHLRKVAIKIVILPHHRESRKRIESSLRRELEILKFTRHPCITRLLAMDITQDRYCIVTPLSEGGDLFELAAKHRKNLKPRMIRRIFAELAIAVSYLHKKNIVHRDIKLENILVNLTVDKLLKLDAFDRTPIITLTDFGLSRTIDPNNPMLVTRCGSEDYVPPELLIGLPYDGRQTDAWALGVVLYAVMESRLPFDPPPMKIMRSKPRVAHRIARIEWSWNNFSDEDSMWSRSDWLGAKEIVEKLLVRRENRMGTEQIIQTEWVKGILPEQFYVD